MGEAMPDVERLVGAEPVVESGSIVVSSGETFTIKLYGLTFEVVLHARTSGLAVETVSQATDKMLIRINTFHRTNLAYKFKVATLWDRELYLALVIDPKQSATVIHYTFSKAP
jgi:hypothetical protein